jgi:endonuclease/exonuclease/phosphatase family metal-dependent hydrolase
MISIRHLIAKWRRASQLTAIFFIAQCIHVHAEDVAPGTRPHPANSLRFCSYNLKNWLEMDRRFNAPRNSTDNLKPKPEKEKAKAVAIIKALNPEILGVCEIGTPEDLADLKQHLAEVGLDYPYTEHTGGGDPTRHLALLSRYPIIAHHHQTNLTYNIGDLTFPVQRGFLDATIQIKPNFTLRAIGVHLKSQRAVDEADQALMRRNESALLRAYTKSILTSEPKTELLLYGDFNDNPKSPGIEDIKGERSDPVTRMSDVLLRDTEGEIWTHFYDWQDSYSRLDYFFVSAALHPRVKFRDSFIYRDKDFFAGSDHRPIVLELSTETTKKKR